MFGIGRRWMLHIFFAVDGEKNFFHLFTLLEFLIERNLKSYEKSLQPGAIRSARFPTGMSI